MNTPVKFNNQWKENEDKNIKKANDLIKKFKIDGLVSVNNDYSADIYSRKILRNPGSGEKIFPLGSRELGEESYFYYMWVDTTISIDFVEFNKEITTEGLVDLKNHKGSLGFNIEKNQVEVFDYFSLLHWLVVGASGSGKGVIMRSMFYQLSRFPESEFFFIDKGGDFAKFIDGKKVKFQMDFSVITQNPVRIINFLTFLFIYMEYRNNIYSTHNCTEWEDYNEKRRGLLKLLENNADSNEINEFIGINKVKKDISSFEGLIEELNRELQDDNLSSTIITMKSKELSKIREKLKIKKEVLETLEISKDNDTGFPLVPYTTVVLDEFQTMRTRLKETPVGGIFDSKMDAVLSTCRSSGIRLILGTQDVQKEKIGSGVSNINTRIYYKIDYKSGIAGLGKEINALINSQSFDKSYVVYTNQGLIKPPFSSKAKMDELIRESMDDVPKGYSSFKTNSVMELFLYMAENAKGSMILNTYEKFLKILKFKESEIERMKKNDNFIILIVYIFAMFRFYSSGSLNNENLDIQASVSLSNKIDDALYGYLNTLDRGDELIKQTKTMLGVVNTPNGGKEDKENFISLMKNIVRSFYNSRIKDFNSEDLDEVLDENETINNSNIVIGSDTKTQTTKTIEHNISDPFAGL